MLRILGLNLNIQDKKTIFNLFYNKKVTMKNAVLYLMMKKSMLSLKEQKLETNFITVAT